MFLSYASDDEDRIAPVREALRGEGYDVWQDRHRILAGERWRSSIDRALRECDGVVVCATSKASRSPFVTYEWATALGRDLPVLAIALDDQPAIHPRLTTMDVAGEKWREELRRRIDSRPVPLAVRNLVERFGSESETVRRDAVQALATLDSPAAERALVETLDHGRDDVRVEAARMLVHTGDTRFLDPLLAAIATHGDTRSVILQFFGRWWHEDVFHRLIEELERRQDEPWVYEVVGCLGNHGGREYDTTPAVDVLAAIVERVSADVRAYLEEPQLWLGSASVWNLGLLAADDRASSGARERATEVALRLFESLCVAAESGGWSDGGRQLLNRTAETLLRLGGRGLEAIDDPRARSVLRERPDDRSQPERGL